MLITWYTKRNKGRFKSNNERRNLIGWWYDPTILLWTSTYTITDSIIMRSPNSQVQPTTQSYRALHRLEFRRLPKFYFYCFTSCSVPSRVPHWRFPARTVLSLLQSRSTYRLPSFQFPCPFCTAVSHSQVTFDGRSSPGVKLGISQDYLLWKGRLSIQRRLHCTRKLYLKNKNIL